MSDETLRVDENRQSSGSSRYLVVAWVMWAIGAVLYAAAVIVASILAASPMSQDDDGSVALVVLPNAAQFLAVPLGIISFVLAMISIFNRQAKRALAVVLVLLVATSACVLVLYHLWVRI